MGKEYQAVSIVAAKYIVDILIFPSLVFYYFNYTNIFYHHTKAILLDNLDDLL